MADIASALTAGAYSKFTTGLDLANTADAMENDIIKLENEIHNREIQTKHQNMKNVAERTKELTF